eukprot:gnl/TRDRNA2_/TRDRNA2_136430_c0_seq1.p1 gnl/TRDRNA2_/TRDRNA2_136430_c0~~gnl/TRDRNA2_/TRDRNA2_136430_c0_seq1.p1  ORF type:complete len:606 (-),score=96.55 gnl/TRDRNA2_/TRDRNA2_136430_c0_seq1:49-1866(-)
MCGSVSLHIENPPVWCRHEVLVFPGLAPGDRINLPFVLPKALGPTQFTDGSGRALAICEDTLRKTDCDVLRDELLWLRAGRDGSVAGAAGERWVVVHLYSAPEEASAASQAASRPEDVLLLAEFFRGGLRLGLHAGNWQLREGEEQHINVIDHPVPTSPARPGRALVLQPAGTGRVALCRSLPPSLTSRPRDRLHLRMHFFDELRPLDDRPLWEAQKRTQQLNWAHWHTMDVNEPGNWHSRPFAATGTGHWAVLSSPAGVGGVGVAPGIGCCYSFFVGGHPGRGPAPGTRRGAAWRMTSQARTYGWHLFELELEGGELSVSIDGRCIETVKVPAERSSTMSSSSEEDGEWMLRDHDVEEEEVWLMGSGGQPGIWSSIELFRTPPSRDIATALRDSYRESFACVRKPWMTASEEHGRWQFDIHGVMQALIVEAPPRLLPPPPPASAPPALPEAEQEEKDEEPVRPDTAPPLMVPVEPLVIECWALPTYETNEARVERCVQIFLAALKDSMPENMHRIARCSDTGCYVYAFGTRQIRLSVREGEGGKLLLVVRCGGGFVDFSEFVQRHGSLERMRLRRRRRGSLPSGREVIRLTSVLSRRSLRVRQG